MIRPVLAARGQIGRVLAAVKAGIAVLIHDIFTAADGTAINGRTPAPTNTPGNTWAALGTATWTIQGNKASKTGGGGNNLVVVNAADADVTITCDVTVANTAERQGIGLRATDINNFWGVSWKNTNVVELVERSGGTLSVRATTALTLTPGTSHEFKVVANGATITGYVDGVQYVTYGSATSNQSATSHGLYGGSTAAPTWDNFIVLAA